ncbi:SCO family protein [Terriglobus sp. ADX1]|uniref:SCO family protein n=1 Tax=Terriglobus sp. ADX1 TaxID=2794063 RepID=UPI002FE53992
MRFRGVFLALTLLWAGVPAVAQGYSSDHAMGAHAQQLPAYLQQAGLEQRLNQLLPMSATFTDETGHTGPLSDWFHGRPVVMALIYYKCAMLCPQVLHGLSAGLHDVTLRPGKDYDVLTFSIDPTDTPADAVKQKQQFLADVGKNAPADAVHFLVGTPADIAAISGSTGFHYVKVPGPDGKMDQFAHSSAIMFATPDGKLSKYLTGVDFPARDLRMALLEASERKISNPVDLLILYCCSYNPVVGKYTVSILRILSFAAMFAVVVVVGMLVVLTRKSKATA